MFSAGSAYRPCELLVRRGPFRYGPPHDPRHRRERFCNGKHLRLHLVYTNNE
jgi:hypothetical protein